MYYTSIALELDRQCVVLVIILEHFIELMRRIEKPEMS